MSFYREFPQLVDKAQKRLKHDNLVFELWKPVGDELIYTCEITCEKDVYAAVHVWQEAMKEYSDQSLSDTGSIAKMGTKGGAFIATFPGPDSESTVPRKPEDNSDQDVVALNNEAIRRRRNHSKYLYDYFGPSIDSGFRVLSMCTSRYFTMSVEVALAILSYEYSRLTEFVRDGEADFSNPHPVVLMEMALLKGVWNGREYPIFAHDLDSEDPVNKALSKINVLEAETENMINLCKACYQSEDWVGKLYLPNSGSEEFRSRPVDPLRDYASESKVGAEEKAKSQLNGEHLGVDPPME